MQHRVANFLNNAAEFAKNFGKEAVNELNQALYKHRFGYGTRAGSAAENIAQQVQLKAKGLGGSVPAAVAATVADVATDETRRQFTWRYTNVPRMAGMAGKKLAQSAGMDPVTGAILAATTPAVLMSLSGNLGPITQGLRPRGYKSVVPASKEEDPTGRQTMSVPLETGMRYLFSQRSQILPYQEFKKERPDILPSTYSAFRKYEYSKAKPGELLTIDPKGQSFTTPGGLIRGTARGLADPEIRIKGFPITASGAIGTAAGLAAASTLYKSLPREGAAFHQAAASGLHSPETAAQIKAAIKPYDVEAVPVKVSGERTTYVPHVGTSLAVIGAGLGTSALVGAATKKLFAKAEERRVKKENPVEYLRYKHGDLAAAKEALGQPQARSWQDLTPYVK